MKKLSVLLCLLSSIALANEKPVNPFGFYRITGYEKYDGNKEYYCHLDTVYISISKTHYDYSDSTKIEGTRSSLSIVWDQEDNRPYRCDKFKRQRDRLMPEYAEEYEEYQEYIRKNQPARVPAILKHK